MPDDLITIAAVVIEKLPEDVQDFVLEQCLFVSISPDDQHGFTAPTQPRT
jgi:hypothetical protein